MLENFKYDNLKKMTISELTLLADEIRKRIIDVVSINGGHLSANLGVVELTIAIHKIFNLPSDLLIFDVSHQTYAHKILTGRNEQFESLRQINGLSGFSKCSESEFDSFEAGHSSTAISAGLGFLEAKKAGFIDGQVITLVGDASIVNGLSFEGLNYLGAHPEQKMIIILNDNEMSISKNVGALAKTFNNIRTKGHFRFLRKITPKSIKRMIKSFAYESNIFESMGIRYFEGIDGHDFKELIKYLTFAKNYHSSVVLHVKTKKGKGFIFSEEDYTGIWHNVEGFNQITGIISNSKKDIPNFGESLTKAIITLIEQDYPIRVITPAMSLGSGLRELSFNKKYHNHFIDVGIAEENAIVMAASMAQSGLIPIVFIYSTFLQRAYDELLHDIARTKQKVIICLDRSGIVSGDGDTHQGIFDLAYLKSIPGITIFAPASPDEAVLLLNDIIKNDSHYDYPIVIKYPKAGKNYAINFEKPLDYQFIKRNKKEKAILTYGTLFQEIDEDSRFSDISLIKLTKVWPLNEQFILELFNNFKEIYIYEEVIQTASLGETILSFYAKYLISERIKPLKIFTLSLPDDYLITGKRNEIKEIYNNNLDTLNAIMKGK